MAHRTRRQRAELERTERCRWCVCLKCVAPLGVHVCTRRASRRRDARETSIGTPRGRGRRRASRRALARRPPRAPPRGREIYNRSEPRSEMREASESVCAFLSYDLRLRTLGDALGLRLYTLYTLVKSFSLQRERRESLRVQDETYHAQADCAPCLHT